MLIASKECLIKQGTFFKDKQIAVCTEIQKIDVSNF